MRWLPRTLFGRLVLVLFGGLVLAQLLSAAINFAERDQMLFRARGMQSAQRIAEVVKLVDSLGEAERQRVVAVLNVPPQVVALTAAPLPPEAPAAAGPELALFSAALRAALGDGREIRVATREAIPGGPPGFMPRRHEAMMRGASPPPGMHRMLMGGRFFLTQVRLADGRWLLFDTHVPREAAGLPGRLLLTLGILLAAVLLASFLAVRWVTRPLQVLAVAADELGRDIHRPPLAEDGPLEVQRAAHAFNTMQARLAQFLESRTRVLAAMSHDLKTPLTRLRLRADLLDDEDLRARFERDLGEMEAMVAETLDFMRGLGDGTPRRPVDVMALLESLQADNEAMGRTVAIEGCTTAPYPAVPQMLRRCLANLIDNAVLYGGRAAIRVEDGPAALAIRIADEGPGIPEAELETVFEPYRRLEASRSRGTGGTGLGLGIARDIARAHGGEVRLANRPTGGLEALVTLPR